MDNSFSSKIAIITGGGSGIGKEVAARLVNAGANVVIGGRDEAKLRQAAADIDPSGARVRVHAGDIARPGTATALVELATQAFGGVDILVNNAGVFRPKAFLDVNESEYDWFLDTILKGKFFMAQAAAKAMQLRGGGAIVQTGSLWALQAIGATPSAAYSAANGGV
ncbi:SDR family NAD(P)-dependent oxidoreductase, partial [Paraburkholderia diazotrophica]